MSNEIMKLPLIPNTQEGKSKYFYSLSLFHPPYIFHLLILVALALAESRDYLWCWVGCVLII